MGRNITRSGREAGLSVTSVRQDVKQNKFRLNYIESSVLNRLHTDLKLKEEIESIERKWIRRR